MRSYLLVTLTCIIMTLMGVKETMAAAIDNQAACTTRAYNIYDGFTKRGCDKNLAPERCKALFDFAIKNLNQDLEKCERSDYVTLCRIVPGGIWPWDPNCSSLQQFGKISKAECEIERQKDYTFVAAGTYEKTIFKAKDAKCINTINYNCHSLCG